MDAINLANPVNRADPLNRGLKAWYFTYRQNVTNQRWRDSSGINNATLTNGLAWNSVAPRLGGFGSLRFDVLGSDYVSIPTTLSLPGEMTIGAWVYCVNPASGAHHGLFADNDIAGQYLVRISATATIHFYSGYTSDGIVLTSGFTMNSAQWYHIAVTRSGSAGSWTLKIFINGSLNNSAVVTNNPPASPTSIRLGSAPVYGFYFDGSMDDVRFYDRALTDGEMNRLYQQSRLGYPTALNRIRPTYGFIAAGGGGGTVRPRSLLTLGCGC